MNSPAVGIFNREPSREASFPLSESKRRPRRHTEEIEDESKEWKAKGTG